MENQCTATAKSTGERCQRPAIKGGTVCYQHGGASEQVQNKAQERLDEIADSATADFQDRLNDFADQYDDADDIETKVKVMREMRKCLTDILDLTGHGPTETREHTGGDGGPVQHNLVIGEPTDE
jgi:hypothetical protein